MPGIRVAGPDSPTQEVQRQEALDIAHQWWVLPSSVMLFALGLFWGTGDEPEISPCLGHTPPSTSLGLNLILQVQ